MRDTRDAEHLKLMKRLLKKRLLKGMRKGNFGNFVRTSCKGKVSIPI